MSSHTRRLADVLRIADNTAKALKTDAHNSEYSRGLYNGFLLFISIFTCKEYEPIEPKQEVKNEN